MKRFLTVVMAVLFGTTLAFGQGTSGSPGKNRTTASGKKGASGKKATTKAKKGHGKISSKTHKGGKKGSTTPK